MSSLWVEPPAGSLFADEQVLLEVDPGYAGPRVYAPRKPQQTVLYRLVQDNLETWLAARREACLDDDPIPAYVEKAFRNYLICGIWAAGLVKFACPRGCDDAVFVALSCRTRGLCPSCGAKYMAKTAMHLEQNVLPRVPYRQWVVSFPKRVRYFLQRDPQRFRAVLRSCMRAIESTVRAGCPQAPRTARVGAVLFAQGFGSSLNAHPHGHFVVSEGVYALDDEGRLTFYERLDALDATAIAQLTDTLRRRVLRHLVRADCLDAGDAADMLRWDHHGGFSLDCSVSLADWDRAALARICRYCARHPFAKGRLQRAGPQRVLYQLCDGLVPRAPYRQIVFTFPVPLRLAMIRDSTVLSAVLSAVLKRTIRALFAQLRRRREALLQKATRGELKIGLPVGFIDDDQGQVRLHPDIQVQRSIRLLFETFRRTGTAGATQAPHPHSLQGRHHRKPRAAVARKRLAQAPDTSRDRGPDRSPARASRRKGHR